MIKKFRKLPVLIEAVRYDGSELSAQEVRSFTECRAVIYRDWREQLYVEIETLEGAMCVSEGDYVIKGVCGEFYPCKPEIFAKTYEAVD